MTIIHRFGFISTLVFSLMFIMVLSYQFTQITDIKEYNSRWLKMVPQKYVHNYTGKYRTAQKCNNSACQYYVYQLTHQKSQQQENEGNMEFGQKQYNNQATILLVSGMHGDQLIGPTALYYAYKQLASLNPYKILFFPLANPSGFILKKRQTSNNVDPNRDFPFQNNKTCYRIASTRILEDIFRQHRIDITISIHNGGSQIAWVWGSPSYLKNSHTSQQQIYQTIGKALKKYGGSNNILEPFKIGTMNQVVYPVEGGFQDWAYGASSQQDKFTANKCSSEPYQPYHEGMTNSLSFIWEIGPHKTSPILYGLSQGINMFANETNPANGYISRAIRMLKQVVHVANPTIKIQASIKQFAITLFGCSQAKVNLRVIRNFAQDDTEELILNDYIMSGSLKQDQYQPQHFFTTTLPESLELFYTYQFICDQNWYDKGRTIFSKGRIFEKEGQIKVQKQPIQRKVWKVKEQSLFMPILITVVLLLLAILIYVMYILYYKIRELYAEQQRKKKKKNSRTQIQMKYQTVHNLQEQNTL